MLKYLKRFGMLVDLCLELGYSPEQLTDYLRQKCTPIAFERYNVILQDHLEDDIKTTKEYSLSFNVTKERVRQIFYNGYRKLDLAVSEKNPNIKGWEYCDTILQKK